MKNILDKSLQYLLLGRHMLQCPLSLRLFMTKNRVSRLV